MNETVVVVHPLSYGRGVLPAMLNFLTTRECFIGYFKEIFICESSASVIGFQYSDVGWPRALKTVAFIVYTDKSPDDLISKEDLIYSKPYTLKGHLRSTHLSKYDSIVAYSRSEKESVLFKDLFQLY